VFALLFPTASGFEEREEENDNRGARLKGYWDDLNGFERWPAMAPSQ
jgi:hypothetical protein